MFRQLDQRTQNFYKRVAEMITRINSNKSTIKAEVYKTTAPERFQPLLHKVLLNFKLLKKAVKKTDFMKNMTLGAVIAHEVLTRNIRNDGFRRKLKQAIGKEQLKQVVTRTFVRINTLRASESDLEGFITEKTCIPNVYEIFDDITTNKENTENTADSEQIESYDEEENELSSAEEAKTKSTTNKKIKDLFLLKLVPEKIKVQNFSSCLPAFILNPAKGSTVIDATASPGNKTTHLCSIMENTGKIIAFERNEERYRTLTEQVKLYGATNTECIHKDFLKATAAEYKPDYILLDPSCSGSGIHINYQKIQKRIDTLHNFQAMMLNHALKFGAKKVVYSTCSTHKEEGEDVVKEALEKNSDYELERIGDYTKERGYPEYEFSDFVLRTSGEADGTVGFFVALFVKKELKE